MQEVSGSIPLSSTKFKPSPVAGVFCLSILILTTSKNTGIPLRKVGISSVCTLIRPNNVHSITQAYRCTDKDAVLNTNEI